MAAAWSESDWLESVREAEKAAEEEEEREEVALVTPGLPAEGIYSTSRRWVAKADPTFDQQDGHSRPGPPNKNSLFSCLGYSLLELSRSIHRILYYELK